MTDIQDFTPAQVMAMGYKRIKSIQDRHGINSPEVLSACTRWGGILDDINFPDSSCRWCGEAVKHNHNMNWYYHVGSEMRECWADAPAVAAPVKTTPSGVAYVPTKAKKVIRK